MKPNTLRLTEVLIAVDTRSFLWVSNAQYRPSLAQTARAVSRTGDGYLQILLPLTLLAFGVDHAEQLFLAVLCAFSVWMPLYWLLKNSLKRRRPPQAIPHFKALIVASDEFSFPSGHTAGAFILAALCSVFYGAFALPLILWACAVGASRVVLGVHFPGDVIAGATLGVSISSSIVWLLGT